MARSMKIQRALLGTIELAPRLMWAAPPTWSDPIASGTIIQTTLGRGHRSTERD
jgi:hypothetical protein